MPDYIGLKAEDSKVIYAGMTDMQRVTAINTTNVTNELPVSGAKIGALWARRGIMGTAYERANRAALTVAQRANAWSAIAMVQNDGFSGLDPRNAAQRTALIAFLDSLVTDTIMTAADKTATLALLIPTQTIAQSLDFPSGIAVADLIAARGM